MKKWGLIIFALTVAGIAFVAGKTYSYNASTQNMQVFQSHVGIAFFDKSNGMIYIYDSNLTDCVEIKQIKEFGKAIESQERPSHWMY